MKRTLTASLALVLTLCLPAGALPVSSDPEPRIEWQDVKGLTLSDLLPSRSTTDTSRVDVDPGVPPEGDYLGWMAWTRDGSKLLLTNRGTDNITVFDAATMQVDTNIPTGDYPGAIAVTDSLCIVALGFSDSIEVFRLSDWTRLCGLPSGIQPWVIRLSPDDSLAFVSCDISNTCEVYDLAALTHLRSITGFPVFLSTYSWNSENGRNSFTFSDFGVHPDGNRLIVPNGLDTVFVFSIEGGPPVDTITGFGDCRNVRFSGDNRVAVIVDGGSPMTAHRLDLDSMQVNAAVTIDGHSVGMDRSCGVNWDGTKTFVSISDNKSAMVRFETGDYVVYSETYSAFWIGVSPDHRLAVSGQYRFTVIDFDSELIVGQHQGNAQSLGEVSPVGYFAAGVDPHRHEGVYFYAFDTVAAPSYRGTANSGSDPEGDGPRRVAITPDGSKIVVANVLSDNATIIDAEAWTVDTVLPCGDRPQGTATTGDGRWAVVASVGSNRATVIDLADNTVAAQVDCGSGPWPLVIGPGDSLAYVGNLSGNTVGVIRLDGAASRLLAEVPVGEVGVVWAGYGVASGLAVSPNAEYLLVCVSFEDVVRVIDTRTRTVVAALTVGDFPLQAEFSASGEYAVVSNYFSNDYSVARIQADSSYVVGTYPTGQAPLRLCRNPVADEVGIGNYAGKTMVTVNPENGNVIRTDYFTSYGSLVQVGFDELGRPMALTMSVGDFPGHLHRGTDHVELPAVPTLFAYSALAQRAAVAMPGPDWVSIVQWSPSGGSESPDAKRPRFRVWPSLSSGSVQVSYAPVTPENLRVKVYDPSGRLVSEQRLTADCPGLAKLDLHGLPSGVYVVRLDGKGYSAVCRVVIRR